CGEESDPPPLEPPVQTVNELVETTGWFPEIVPDSTAFSQARFDSSNSQGDLDCADFIGYQLREIAALTVLAADEDLHYPGAVLQYASLGTATPDPVTAPRAAASLELTGADGTVVSGAVDALDGDLVAAWRADAASQLPADLGTWDLELAEIRDPAMIPIAIGVDPAAIPAAALDALLPTTDATTRVLVRLERMHHTVSCAYPGRAGQAFADEVVGEDLADQMAEGNPPVWVGDVDHGQLVLLLVEADASYDTVIDACLNSFVAAASGAAPDGGRPLVHELPELAVAAHAVAADAASAAQATVDGPDALAAWLATPVDSPASLPPIAADLFALRNGGPLTLGIEADFVFTSCEVYDAVFDEVLWSLDAADARTERRLGDLESQGTGRFFYEGGSRQFLYDYVVAVPDLRGAGGAAVPDQFGQDPILFHDIAGGRPAIELYELALPDGDIYSQLLFDGSPLVGTSYTLFLVINMPSIIRLTVVADPDDVVYSRPNDVNYILHGEENGQRRNLMAGFPSRRELAFEHLPYELRIDHDRTEGWKVYAFRFDRDGGMSIWLDGEQLGSTGWDFSLLSFGGARLCARWRGETSVAHASYLLAEAVAYRGAGSDAQVIAETERLREKYGF
ncbi:hypothetical protein GF314_14625, partial [bacterium]|nr:hypothetical protein [bacterium]